MEKKLDKKQPIIEAEVKEINEETNFVKVNPDGTPIEEPASENVPATTGTEKKVGLLGKLGNWCSTKDEAHQNKLAERQQAKEAKLKEKAEKAKEEKHPKLKKFLKGAAIVGGGMAAVTVAAIALSPDANGQSQPEENQTQCLPGSSDIQDAEFTEIPQEMPETEMNVVETNTSAAEVTAVEEPVT